MEEKFLSPYVGWRAAAPPGLREQSPGPMAGGQRNRAGRIGNATALVRRQLGSVPPSAPRRRPRRAGSCGVPSAPRQPRRSGPQPGGAQRDFGWCWTGVAGGGRGAPQGCPGAQASGRAVGKGCFQVQSRPSANETHCLTGRSAASWARMRRGICTCSNSWQSTSGYQSELV